MSVTHSSEPSETPEPNGKSADRPETTTAIGPGPGDAIDLEIDPTVESSED